MLDVGDGGAMSALEHRRTRNEQQLRRRIARRVCGLDGEQAEEMVDWAGQSIPICGRCKRFLDSRRYRDPFCAYYEMSPEQMGLQPHDTAAYAEVESGADSGVVARALKWIWGP